ncbi:MAG: TetR/AcrR family transcriptional regulator [Candidatus Hadarchaeota archaeon]
MTDQSVKTRILENALDLYTSKPPQMVTVDEVAEAVGVSKGLIFYHFKSKDNLEKEVAYYTFNKLFTESIKKIHSVDDLIDVTVDNFINLPHVMNFFAYISGKVLHSGDFELFRGFYEELNKIVIPLFEKEGIRDPAVTATAIMSMFDGLALYSMFYDIGDIENYRKLAKDFVKCRRLDK